MTKQVLFVQGGGEGVHDEWDSRIPESLERELGPDYAVRYPRMPHEADPKYAAWKTTLKRQVGELTFGGIFLIAAPFVGDGGWHSEDIEPLSDLGAKLPEQAPIYLYHGSKDKTAPFEHVYLYAKAIPQAVVRQLSGRDHQLNNDMSEVAADIRRLGAMRVSPSPLRPVPQ